MTALAKFPINGFGLFDGSLLNKIVDAVNSLQGAGGSTPGPVAGSTVTSTGNVDHQGAVFALDSLETGVTAHAGGGQSSATQLTKAISRIDTCATAANSVKLPAPSIIGQLQIVINNGAASAQVYGFGTDTINGVATGTGVAQANGKTALYVAVSTGTAAAWFRLLSA